MLRLHQTFGAHAGRTRELSQQVIRFGRLPSNDFAFDAHADLDASGLHAEIRFEGGHWVLVDVGSRNGTLVDGRAIQRHVLAGGEEIEFGAGGPRVRVEIAPGEPSGPAPGASGRGVPTAPATPLEPLGAPAFTPPVAPMGPGSQPPFAPPAVSTPAPIPPSTAPPPMTAGPSEAPKLYGQRTVESMIQSAAVAAAERARRETPPSPAPPPPASIASSQYIRDVAAEAAGRSSRPMAFALGAVFVLFVLVLCAMTGLVIVLASRAYGGPF